MRPGMIEILSFEINVPLGNVETNRQNKQKITEMISCKFVTGERQMMAQIYLKTGALVPMHSHESEQMMYVLQGALRVLVGGNEITIREGDVLHIPSWIDHQAEALQDTFGLSVFSPIRQNWPSKTDIDVRGLL